MDSQFKPCPFCGSTSQFLRDHAENCYLQVCVYEAMQQFGVPHNDEGFTHVEEIESWNTRFYFSDETAGYFILPKPKETLTEHFNIIETSDDGKVSMSEHFNVIQSALDNWKKEIDAKIQKRLFETFRPISKRVEIEGETYIFRCGNCGEYIIDSDNYCSECGAKVVE